MARRTSAGNKQKSSHAKRPIKKNGRGKRSLLSRLKFW
jgi:hypothetical protein